MEYLIAAVLFVLGYFIYKIIWVFWNGRPLSGEEKEVLKEMFPIPQEPESKHETEGVESPSAAEEWSKFEKFKAEAEKGLRALKLSDAKLAEIKQMEFGDAFLHDEEAKAMISMMLRLVFSKATRCGEDPEKAFMYIGKTMKEASVGTVLEFISTVLGEYEKADASERWHDEWWEPYGANGRPNPWLFKSRPDLYSM